jgi:hypothetical protein
MFRLCASGWTTLIDLVPKLQPTPLTEHERTTPQNNARPAFEPIHARATKPLLGVTVFPSRDIRVALMANFQFFAPFWHDLIVNSHRHQSTATSLNLHKKLLQELDKYCACHIRNRQGFE